MGANWIRLKYGKKKKGSDKKFTLLSRKNMDNDDGDKIKIRSIVSEKGDQRHGHLLEGRVRKTRRIMITQTQYHIFIISVVL